MFLKHYLFIKFADRPASHPISLIKWAGLTWAWWARSLLLCQVTHMSWGVLGQASRCGRVAGLANACGLGDRSNPKQKRPCYWDVSKWGQSRFRFSKAERERWLFEESQKDNGWREGMKSRGENKNWMILNWCVLEVVGTQLLRTKFGGVSPDLANTGCSGLWALPLEMQFNF